MSEGKWEKVERFSPARLPESATYMIKSEHGLYYRHSDYAALLASHRELVGALEQGAELCEDGDSGVDFDRVVQFMHVAIAALANAKGSE